MGFSFHRTGTPTLIKMVIADAKGKFNASGLPAGNVDFKWELATYITVDELNFRIVAGKEVKRAIVLKKAP